MAIDPVTPRNLPNTISGRGTGLLTTVITVLFSISRDKTPVAVNAASNRPARNSVLKPRSTSSLLSSSSVKPARLTLSTSASSAPQMITVWIGCRIDSRNALRASVRRIMGAPPGAFRGPCTLRQSGGREKGVGGR